jgi:hypothetical protein
MQIMTYAENKLVQRHRGTMPIILTSPHGGSDTPPGVSERTDEETPPGCDFEPDRDNETALIIESVAQRILDVTGLSPYVVIAQFHRKYIDANRDEACAYIDRDAQPFYREYHDRIAGYVSQVLSQNQNRGFLFDIHGTQVIDADPADVYLGTADGAALPAGFDRRVIFMQHGLHGLLKWARHRKGANGTGPLVSYRVSPADETTPETSAVSGGFTVTNYGATINSIQVEIADTIRDDPELRGFFIDDLAFAIINFVRRYAPF